MSNRKLRLGIIGCGRVVERFHLPAIRASRMWEVVAVADESEERLAWAERHVRGAQVFRAAESLLERGQLDAVLVASPPVTHREYAIEALSAGAHVLVEKPCGLSSAEARKMADAARLRGKHLRVAYNRRFHPSYVGLKSRLASLGAESCPSGEFKLTFSVAGWASASGYLGEGEVGGGVLHDVASHQLDLLTWLFDTPIRDLRLRSFHRFSNMSEEARYLVTVADGSPVECLARHGVGYLESLLVCDKNEVLFAFPTGLLRGPIREPRQYERAANRHEWMSRRLIRLGLKGDRMLRSFEKQWDAFADLVSGASPASAPASASDAIRVHEALHALQESVIALDGDPEVGEGALGAPTNVGLSWQAPVPPVSLKAKHSPAMRQESRVSEARPAVSVIMVAGNQRQRASVALQSVLAQDGISQAEVLLVDLGTPEHPPLEGSAHPSVQQLQLGGMRSYGEARAEAVRRARGEVVAFLEEHSRVSPGWLRALVACFAEGPWVAVGPRVVSGNPGVGFSDAMGLINYGNWTGSQVARETDMLPGNNSAYRRQALLDLDPELNRLLLADTVLQWRLSEEGGRLFAEPKAVLAHRYPTTLLSAAKGEYLYHVCFADVRAQSFEWPWSMRIAYAAGSLLIPWVRLVRMLRTTKETENAQLLRRNVFGVVYLLYAAVLGQAVGALFGSRGTELRFSNYELNEPRPTKDELASRR